MTIRRNLALSCALAAFIAATAYAQGAGSPTPRMAAATKAHLAVGVVHGVDLKSRSLTISHQAIPSLAMPAMTMSFDADPSVDISAVKPGDSVAFVLSSGAAGGLAISSLQTVAGGTTLSQAPAAGMPGMPRSSGNMMMMGQCQEMMMNRK
jgi:Cu(I)/Ag(I) efflux system periplasmic protein CusF